MNFTVTTITISFHRGVSRNEILILLFLAKSLRDTFNVFVVDDTAVVAAILAREIGRWWWWWWCRRSGGRRNETGGNKTKHPPPLRTTTFDPHARTHHYYYYYVVRATNVLQTLTFYRRWRCGCRYWCDYFTVAVITAPQITDGRRWSGRRRAPIVRPRRWKNHSRPSRNSIRGRGGIYNSHDDNTIYVLTRYGRSVFNARTVRRDGRRRRARPSFA